MEDKVEKEDAGEVSRPFPWKDHKYQGEPQWDHFTDSDGEQYETYSDGTHEMTKKEMKEYARQVKESDVRHLSFPFHVFYWSDIPAVSMWSKYFCYHGPLQGYDVQEFDKVTAFGIIQPLLLTEKSIPEFERLASIALSEYNKDKVSLKYSVICEFGDFLFHHLLSRFNINCMYVLNFSGQKVAG